MSMFKKATKTRVNLRLALIGPSGSGKTFTALRLAHGLAKQGEAIGMIDTEGGSGSRYAEEPNPDGGVFDFAAMELTRFAPADYIRAMKAAHAEGIRILIIDSLSHAWAGTGGVQDIVDAAAARAKGNSFSGWREGTPAHNELIDAILGCSMHLIVTMRVKTEWVIDEVGGKKTPRKIGMAPVQRAGMEYEFDVVGDLDDQHSMSIAKTRCSRLDGRVWRSPGANVADELLSWMGSGAPVVQREATAPPADPAPSPFLAFGADLARLGMTLDVVASICASRSRPPPDRMAADDRAKLLAWLATDTGRAAYREASGAGPTSTDPAAYPFPPPPADGVTYGKWAANAQKAFCAEVVRLGFAYDAVAALCEQRGRARPSVMPPADRATLLRWLQTAEARAALPRAGGDQ